MTTIKIQCDGTVPTGWNDAGANNATGVKIADCLDDAGESTGVTLTQEKAFSTVQTAVADAGTTHGWPQAVWTNNFAGFNLTGHFFTFSGLPVGATFSIKLAGHASQAFRLVDFAVPEADAPTTLRYTPSETSTPTEQVEFTGTVPADGEIEVHMDPVNSWMYLSGMELTFDSGSAGGRRQLIVVS